MAITNNALQASPCFNGPVIINAAYPKMIEFSLPLLIDKLCNVFLTECEVCCM